MKLPFGLSLTLTRAKALSSVSDNRGGWWPLVMEPFAGAWQRNQSIDRGQVLSNYAVFACATLIASDIAKLRVKLVEKDAAGIWSEASSASFSPVLRKPNHFQTRIQFWENYILSKLLRGNTYVLKQRDQRGVVVALYVLDPTRVKPLVSDDGAVFYEINPDNLAAQDAQIIVPAREIIHDRMNCIFHPLMGVSPIYASGLAATQGLNIQHNSNWFFANKSMPGAVLTAPGQIHPETAARLKEAWDANYSGANAGKVAVLGDGLTFTKIPISAEESQMIEQLKWSGEVICSTFHVPPYKVGIGAMPTYNNIQSLNVEYYSQCLQSLIESAEICLDEGLGIGDGVSVSGPDGKVATYGTEFDIDGLLRMDSVTQFDVLEKAKSVLTLDERRKKLDAPALKVGGGTVYLQQQDHSIEAIAARDKLLIEQSKNPTPTPPAPTPPPQPPDDEPDEEPDDEEVERALIAAMTKHWDIAISEVPAYGR